MKTRHSFSSFVATHVIAGMVFLWSSIWPLSAGNRSGETYLLIARQGVQQVMRVNDPASEGVSLGYLATFSRPIEEMAVSPDRTLHLIEHLGSETWEISPDQLLRQVFDDRVLEANWGWHSVEHSDGRVAFGPEESKRPIFRSFGAAHSAGPGSPWEGDVPQTPMGVTVFPGKQWYLIPNGSWYQSWESLAATGLYSVSHPVCRDRLEIRDHLWREIRWREDAAVASASAVASEIGRFRQMRLSRAVLNGCLETCGNIGGNVVIEESNPRANLVLEPGEPDTPGVVWLLIGAKGSDRRLLTRSGETVSERSLGDASGDWFLLPGSAKRSLSLRFDRNGTVLPWVVGESLIEGKGRTRAPLKGITWDPDLMAISGLSSSDSEQRFRSLAVGNRAAGRVFRLVQPRMDGAADAAWWIDGEFRFSPEAAPLDLQIDHRGKMTFVRMAVTPGLNERPLFERDGIAILEDGRTALGQAVSGRLVMARRYRLEVLELVPGAERPTLLASIPLGEKHFAQRFLMLGALPQVGSGTIAEQIPMLMRAGARFEDGETPAPEFIDTWSPPERVLLAIIDDPPKER